MSYYEQVNTSYTEKILNISTNIYALDRRRTMESFKPKLRRKRKY